MRCIRLQKSELKDSPVSFNKFPFNEEYLEKKNCQPQQAGFRKK